MKKISNICIAILLAILAMPIAAQQIHNGQINISSGEIRHEGDSLYVHMIVDLSHLSLDRNRSLTLTPVLTDGSNTVTMPEILINGTTRHKAFLRSEALSGDHSIEEQSYAVIKLNNENKKPLHYRQTIPYQSWMDAAYVNMKEDLCGCGGYNQELAEAKVIDRMPPRENITEVTPKPNFVQPKPEPVKTRSEQWETYLDFPVNKTMILADYMGNRAKLNNIEEMLRTVRSDSNISISHIKIIGFASPEGGIAHNEDLSKGRAEAFKNYLAGKLDFPSSAYTVEYGGENWDGLKEAVTASNMEDKDEILSIINNTADVNLRKTKLKQLKNGVPYRQMLTNIYPKLRKVISQVTYTVRSFSADEARVIIKTKPKQLSLNEIYMVANTYPVGSEAFIDVFETAVRLYPDDEVANLNAAAAALSAGNIALAEKYLNKADKSSVEYANNLGVLYMLKGEDDKAIPELKKAQTGGIAEARYNLQEIEKRQ